MVDLTAEMAALWTSLGTPAPGHARAIQFIAAQDGEGVSTVAREFARFAAARTARPVWLINTDPASDTQPEAFKADPVRFGPLGDMAQASPDGSMFFAVQPQSLDPSGKPIPNARYLVAHPMNGRKLWVTRFRRDLLVPGQSLHILPLADYWNALRKHAGLIVVDSPSAARTSEGLTIAPFMDCTVLVVAAGGSNTRAASRLKDAILAAGGRCAGLVFNRLAATPPKFLRALLP
jgi:Mrp family chromosome partitioning ATPase